MPVLNAQGQPAQATTVAPGNHQRLLPELMRMVIKEFEEFNCPDDLVWLWFGARHVSRHFMDEIEVIFHKIHLPKTVLYFNMGIHMACWDMYTSNASHMNKFNTSGCFDYGLKRFKYHPFSRTPDRAIFPLTFNSISMAKDVFRRLHEKLLVGAPLVMIQTRRVVNDTGLPGLEIDEESQIIAFDWKEMFTQLLGEEHVFNTLTSQGLGWRLDPRAALANIHETHRRIARRSRLQRQCRALLGTHIFDNYTYDEHDCMSRLYLLRNEMSSRFPNEGPNRMGVNVYAPLNVTKWPGSKLTPGPASIPRGVLTDKEHLPSARDLFTKRIPDLSFGHPKFGDRVPNNTPSYKRGDFIGEVDPSESPLFSREDVVSALKHGERGRTGLSGLKIEPIPNTLPNPLTQSFYVSRDAPEEASTAIVPEETMVVDAEPPSQETAEGYSQSTQATISTMASSVDEPTSLAQSSETIIPSSAAPASPPKRARDEADEARSLLKRVRIHSDEGQL